MHETEESLSSQITPIQRTHETRSLRELTRTIYHIAQNPQPIQYSMKKIHFFIIWFYVVVLFEMVVVLTLIWIYPDDYIANMWDLFFSELGAPITFFGTPNRLGMWIFSSNMAGAVLGCAAYIPLIQLNFPIAKEGFYRCLRFFYLICLGMMSIGCVGVIFPYTTHWALHVIGAFICMIGMWWGWTAFLLFNSPYWKLKNRIIIILIVDIIIWFVIFSELLDWYQEFFQKPGQGLVFGLIVIWPFLHYRQLKKK